MTAIHAAWLAKKLGVVTLKRWQRPLGYGTFFLVSAMSGYQLSLTGCESKFARSINGVPSERARARR